MCHGWWLPLDFKLSPSLDSQFFHSWTHLSCSHMLWVFSLSPLETKSTCMLPWSSLLNRQINVDQIAPMQCWLQQAMKAVQFLLANSQFLILHFTIGFAPLSHGYRYSNESGICNAGDFKHIQMQKIQDTILNACSLWHEPTILLGQIGQQIGITLLHPVSLGAAW